MKILILISLLFSFDASAKCLNKISRVEADKAIALAPDAKGGCISGECFCFDNIDWRKAKFGFVLPMTEETQDCQDASDCQDKIDAEFPFRCGFSATPQFDDKTNWPGLDFTALELPRPATGWFLWCQKEILMNDAAKVSAVDAMDASKAADKAIRLAKKAERTISKDACVAAVNGGSNLTALEVKECLAVVVKEVFAKDIDPLAL